MNYDVYCDESLPDLLTSQKRKGTYFVIGGLWLPTAMRDPLKAAIHELRDQYKMGPEFKWHNVSRSRLDFYKEMVNLFFAFGEHLKFRCIVVDINTVNLNKFHNGDDELGFYAFYYHMLVKWIHKDGSYSIFCDYKKNRMMNRFQSLEKRLRLSIDQNLAITVQPIESKQSVLIQMADVFVGMASARMNERLKQNGAKAELVDYFESQLGRQITPTFLYEQKFNVFAIRL